MNISFSKSKEPLEPPTHVILASQSIGRKTLLDKLGIRFRVVVSNIDEDTITESDPTKMLKKRALAKAEEVAKNPRVYSLSEEAKNIVIAADSMAVLGKKTFGKAKDREGAKEILKALMDKTHVFTTAVNIVYLEGYSIKKRYDKVVQTKVTLGKITQAELEAYVTRYDFTRFAAGYALNETPWDLVTKIDGSYTNVIGLPFEVLLPILRTYKIIL